MAAAAAAYVPLIGPQVDRNTLELEEYATRYTFNEGKSKMYPTKLDRS